MTLIAASHPRCVHAYGLTADDFAHILFTFPVFARKRPAFYAYLLARVQEWKEEGDSDQPACISTGTIYASFIAGYRSTDTICELDSKT